MESFSKRILAIDPGHTVGIAIIDQHGNLEAALTVPYMTIYKNRWLSALLNIADAHAEASLVVVVEEPPVFGRDAITRDLYAHLLRWFEGRAAELASVRPGEWKNLAKRVEIPGQHARDAATMGMWYRQTTAYMQQLID